MTGRTVGFAKPRSGFDSIESNTGCRSTARTADDLEHVGGRGLLLQRLRESRSRLHLLEQPHVLDRDHGLVGEGLQQLDVMSAKWAGSLRVT